MDNNNTTLSFSFQNLPVRVIERNGEPWFVGKDVCDVLSISDARKSVSLLDEDERNTIPVIDSVGRMQDTYIINEAGLYSLVLRSRKPEAKFFKRNNGFRPNRGAEHAISQAYKFMQGQHLHFVVDIDIKGFFDSVNHGKLLKQMWTIGIRDKKLLKIISQMLKAEVAEIGFPV